MNPRFRIKSNQTQSQSQSQSHRFKEYLKPGALARLRDSKISTRVHHQYYVLLTHSVNNDNDSDGNGVSEVAAPEFPVLGRGPQCFGRRKLVATKAVNRVADAGVDLIVSSFVSVN